MLFFTFPLASIIEISEETMVTDGIEFRGRFTTIKSCMQIIEIYPYCLGGKIKKEKMNVPLYRRQVNSNSVKKKSPELKVSLILQNL